MAITTTTITGPILDASGTAYDSAIVRFTPRSVLGDDTADTVLVQTPVDVVPAQVTGAFSVGLFASDLVAYDVSLIHVMPDRERAYKIGAIYVPSTGPVALEDLLPVFSPDTPTNEELLAALSAAVASAEAAADLATIADQGIFDVAATINNVDPAELAKVVDYDDTQDVSVITAAIQSTFDAAIAFLQGGDGRGAVVQLPAGALYVDDELLSDAAQEIWWNQTDLGKKKFLEVRGHDRATQIYVDSTWVSGVRNSANGNERTYGPWANEPSPAMLFPFLASKTAAPACVSLKSFRMVGTGEQGKDPIPYFAMNELDAVTENLHVANFANWGEAIFGSFNSFRKNNQWENNGAQPVESGAIMSADAGFPDPRVSFDYDSGTNTLTAKALDELAGYTAGDVVPFFYTAHIGKTFVLHQGALVSGVSQPLKGTIATVGGDGVSTATLTVPAGVTDQTVAAKAGSFTPVKATTTAASATVTLSAPVKVGRGAADMVGQLVAIPKAGSTADTSLDLFVSRVASCDTGNDTDGYTVLTLADAARDAVTQDFVWSFSHATVNDETSLAGDLCWAINDTDFISCRWEHSAGYSGDVTTTGYMFASQDAGEAVQYVACKAHGANTVRGQFAADGQAIIDSARGLQLTNFDFTHSVMGGVGQVWVMGGKCLARATACSVGSWQLPHDFVGFYLDPQSGYTEANWSFVPTDTSVKNDSFPNGSQKIISGSAGVIQTEYLTRARSNRGGENVMQLTSADDLNDIDFPCSFEWDTDIPANTPSLFDERSTGFVVGLGNTGPIMRVTDVDNEVSFIRERLSGTWQPWRREGTYDATTANLNDAAHKINTAGKFTGVQAFNTTDSKLYVARGQSATATWISADGATTLTPS